MNPLFPHFVQLHPQETGAAGPKKRRKILPGAVGGSQILVQESRLGIFQSLGAEALECFLQRGRAGLGISIPPKSFPRQFQSNPWGFSRGKMQPQRTLDEEGENLHRRLTGSSSASPLYENQEDPKDFAGICWSGSYIPLYCCPSLNREIPKSMPGHPVVATTGQKCPFCHFPLFQVPAPGANPSLAQARATFYPSIQAYPWNSSQKKRHFHGWETTRDLLIPHHPSSHPPLWSQTPPTEPIRGFSPSLGLQILGKGIKQ